MGRRVNVWRVAPAWLVQVGNLYPRQRGTGCVLSFCSDAALSAVALVDSGATHSFVSAALVSKFSLPVKPGGDMEVTLADGSQVEVSQTCCVPLVVCSGDC